MKKAVLAGILALGLTLSPALAAEGSTGFSDVEDGDWFAPYVEVCVRDGLMIGVGDGRFDPEGILSLAEAMVLTVRVERSLHNTPEPAPLPDDLGDLVRFYAPDGTFLGNWGDVVWTRSEDDPVLWIGFPSQLSPQSVTMAVDTEGLDRVGALYAPGGAPQPSYEGTFDPQRKQWGFEDGQTVWGAFLDEACSFYQPTWYREELLQARSLGALYAIREREDLERLLPNALDQAPATRLDLARLIYAVTETQDLWPPLNGLNALPDTQDQAAVALYNFGVLTGVDPQGSFAGERSLTRAEAAAVFSRLLEPELRQRPEVEARRPEELACLTVSHGSFGFVDTEYKLELDQDTLWTFSANPMAGEEERDPQAENEGFQTSISLSPQAIEAFRASEGMAGLLTWSGVYIAPAFDGHQWFMTLTFTDGSNRMLMGSNDYPEEWDALYDDLRALTGKDILSVRSDWFEW